MVKVFRQIRENGSRQQATAWFSPMRQRVVKISLHGIFWAVITQLIARSLGLYLFVLYIQSAHRVVQIHLNMFEDKYTVWSCIIIIVQG